MIQRWIAVAVFASALALPAAEAQCPDGSPPPCGGGAGSRRGVDKNRIAVLPFRVAGAPQLAHLREGLVELLTPSFDGAVGPTAVDAGEVLTVWRNLRTGPEPATPDAARRGAREMGAGQAVYASIVGDEARFTVTASILGTTGEVILAPVQVTGSADSLPTVVATLATRLLGGSVGVPVATSNEAATRYIATAARLRRHPTEQGIIELAQIWRLDTTFILPAFHLTLVRMLLGPTGPMPDSVVPNLLAKLWRQRQRLTNDQRLLLEAMVDSTQMRFRTVALPRIERVAALMPNYAEAWAILGDLLFHVGPMIGRDDWMARSKAALERAHALNPTICTCTREHLGDIAYLERDPAALRRHGADTAWHRYLGALLIGRPPAIKEARLAYVANDLMTWQRGFGLPPFLTGIALPAAEVDTILAVVRASANNDIVASVEPIWRYDFLAKSGRFREAQQALNEIRDRAAPGAPSGTEIEYLRDDASWFARFDTAMRVNPPAAGLNACGAALVMARRGDTTLLHNLLPQAVRADSTVAASVAASRIRRGPTTGQPVLCGETMRGVLASYRPDEDHLVWRADSILRGNPLNCCIVWNGDIAYALARRGHFAAAASAARRRWLAHGVMNPTTLVPMLRNEGRWAALAGDTVAAIKAYEHYLTWRQAPDAELVPQRDSVQSELAALRRARRP